MVAPVAVGADPDLEQRRLVRLHRPVARGRERADAGAGPDEREAVRELDLALPARAAAVHEAVPERAGLALGHARAEMEAAVLHRRGGDVVREPHALDLLLRLDRACGGEERRRVDDVGAEGVEPLVRVRRRLADHAVGGLRAEAELEADAGVAALADGLLRGLGRARDGGTRIGLVVAAKQAQVVRPGGAAGVGLRRLQADERRLALAREDGHVVALHRPEVRQVEDVVGRAHDERVDRPARP